MKQGGRKLRIGIVAAEPSGDLLACGLMRSLKTQHPDVEFEGVAGPLMQRVGVDTWAPMDALSVMGVVEVLHHLPRLLKLRTRLVSRWLASPPDLFIGVDAPDFNLALEQRLRAHGVPTVHYVSPTVWAWRTGRVKQIRRAADLLLVIFPFEADFLARYDIKARYVGHRLANTYPLEPDRAGARERLGLDRHCRVLAVLPGSRAGEVRKLAPTFLRTAQRLRQRFGDLHIVVPLASPQTADMLDAARRACCPTLTVIPVRGGTQEALAACDVALVASGTATFETLLSKRPMVVGYRINRLTYYLIRLLRLVRIKQVAMANLIAGESLAPEFIQSDCVPENLLPPLERFFTDDALRDRIVTRYGAIHRDIQKDADREAARAVLDLARAHGLV